MSRSFSLIGILALCVSLLGCTVQRKNTLEGTWELVSAKYTIGDKTETHQGWREIKIITKTHVAFLSQKSERQKFAAAGTDAERLDAAKTFDAGGGTYTLEGENYTEHIEFFLTPNFVNVSLPFKIKWEGDQWIQTGTIPAKSMGLDDKDWELYEVWRRIE